MVLNPISVSTKGKKRLILDLKYASNYLLQDKIKFDDWNSFKVTCVNSIWRVGITMPIYFMNTKTTLALAGKLITKCIILYLLSYLLYCTFHVYQSGPTINKILASARNKDNSLFFRWWLKYQAWIFKI